MRRRSRAAIPRFITERYQVIAPAGSGAFSDVYRVRDKLLAREVALKRFRLKVRGAIARTLASEFVLLAKLEHQALPRVYDFALDDDQRPFFTMDFLGGPSLAEVQLRLPRGGARSPAMVLARYAARLLSALSFMHSRGIVHGDVKPSNVIFAARSTGAPAWRDLRLVDFGLSAAFSSMDESLPRGTPRYMAPEVVRGGAPDPQSDLFSLGVALREALRPPYSRATMNSSFEDRFEAFLARLEQPSTGLRHRTADQAYGQLLSIIETADRGVAKLLRRSFTISVRPRAWESRSAIIQQRLEGCRGGRGGVVILEGIHGGAAARVLNETRAIALASRMAVVRVGVDPGGRFEGLRGALGGAARVLADSSSRRLRSKDPAAESSEAPPSALAARLTAAARAAGDAGAVFILDGGGVPLPPADLEILKPLALSLWRGSALLIGVGANGGSAGTGSEANGLSIVSFPPLDPAAIEQTLSETFGEIEPRTGLARVLHETSGGDADSLGRILEELVRADLLRRRHGGWIGDPVAVRGPAARAASAGRRRLPLPAGIEAGARALGVLGARFDERSAAAVLRGTSRSLATVLAELKSAGCIHESGSQRGSPEWAFSPPGLAEELSARLSRATRRSLHLRALKHLDSAGVSETTARRARHLAGAGRKAEAAGAYLQSGTALFARNDYVGAGEELDRGLNLVSGSGGEAEMRLRFHLAQALQRTGHAKESLDALRPLLQATARLPDGVSPTDTVLAQAHGLELLGRHAEASESLHEAAQECAANDLVGRARISRMRGWLAYLGGEQQTARQLQAEALQAGKSSGDPVAVAAAHSLAGHILRSAGQLAAAESAFKAAIDLLKQGGEEALSVTELQNLAIVWMRNDPEKALAILRDVQRAAAELGEDALLASALLNRAICERAVGDWEAAEKSYRISIDVGERIGFRGLHRGYMNLGNLLTDRGVFEEAEACLGRATVLAGLLQGSIPSLFVELNRARLELRRNRPEEALLILERASPGLSPVHVSTWINLQLYRAQALAETGRFEEAARAAETAREAANGQEDEVFRAEALLYSGKVERMAGRRESALERLTRAAAEFERLKQVFFVARTSLERAELLFLDPAASAEALREATKACDIFERLGAVPFLSRAGRIRARLAEAVERGAAAPRELQTLYRVAQICNDVSDLPALLEGILDATISLVGAERGMIFLRNEDAEGRLERAASRHLSAAEEKDILRTSQGILKRALSDDAPLLSRDAMQDMRLRSLKSVIKFEIRSVVCAPLRAGRTAIGTIYIDHREPNRFGEKDAEFMRALAGFAAPAIQAAQASARLAQEVRGLRQEVRALRRAGGSQLSPAAIIGTSGAMARVRELVEKCSRTKSVVLVLGETGTGKDLVARLIHYAGARAGMPFISVGGAELGGELVDADLFGTAEGAATGVRERPGKIEQANGGTLYFHEVEALARDTQAKLLRVLEEPHVERVGGTARIPIDVRFIAASSADLRSLVHSGGFRQDLFYRFNVVTIEIPPLRARREDIAPLIRHHLATMCVEQRIAVPPELPAAVLREYEAYSWPGNVRELRHFVERAVLMGGDRFPSLEGLTAADLREGAPALLEDAAARDESLEAIQALYVEMVFDRCGGRKNLAARILKINYRTLERLLELRGRGGKSPR